MSCVCSFVFAYQIVKGSCSAEALQSCIDNQVASILANVTAQQMCCGAGPWPSAPIVNNVLLKLAFNATLAFATTELMPLFTTRVVATDAFSIVAEIVPLQNLNTTTVVPAVASYIRAVSTNATTVTITALHRNATEATSSNATPGLPLIAIVTIGIILFIVCTWFIIKATRKKKEENEIMTHPKIQLRVLAETLNKRQSRANTILANTMETCNPLRNVPESTRPTQEIAEHFELEMPTPSHVVEEEIEPQITEAPIESVPQQEVQIYRPKVSHVHRQSLDPNYSSRFKETLNTLHTIL